MDKMCPIRAHTHNLKTTFGGKKESSKLTTVVVALVVVALVVNAVNSVKEKMYNVVELSKKWSNKNDGKKKKKRGESKIVRGN